MVVARCNTLAKQVLKPASFASRHSFFDFFYLSVTIIKAFFYFDRIFQSKKDDEKENGS